MIKTTEHAIAFIEKAIDIKTSCIRTLQKQLSDARQAQVRGEGNWDTTISVAVLFIEEHRVNIDTLEAVKDFIQRQQGWADFLEHKNRAIE